MVKPYQVGIVVVVVVVDGKSNLLVALLWMWALVDRWDSHQIGLMYSQLGRSPLVPLVVVVVQPDRRNCCPRLVETILLNLSPSGHNRQTLP